MCDSTPICRCRVLYLGSAVPRQSKDGLQGIQEPLRSLYPSEGAIGAKGIDSWLSVWSNGILLENVDENLKQITRFFPIESLHYCAAVRQVLVPERGYSNPEPKFLPLDSPFARTPRAQHPPIFAAILRRTTGIKVLECHIFICKREAAANALVRCCFHAYADNSYAKQLETGGGGGSVYGTLGGEGHSKSNGDMASGSNWNRVGSNGTINSIGMGGRHGDEDVTNNVLNVSGGGSSATEGYTSVKNFYGSTVELAVGDDGETSLYNSDENHKVWNGSQDQLDGIAAESPYEVYSGNASSLGRPARARQISAPIPVPPPPLREETKKKKTKKLPKSSESQSLSGTLIRPKPVHPNSTAQRRGLQHHPGFYRAVGPPNSRQYHTISHRGFPVNGGPPPHAHHNDHYTIPSSHMMPPPPHHAHHMQMPIMLPQQYATLQPTYSSKKNKKDRMSGIPVGMPILPPMYTYHQVPSSSADPKSMIGDPRPIAMSSRKLAQSAGNGLDNPGGGNSRAESPEGTGIYRRKGHLNERAFSYSIRQEHRSRSHGSLASLQFNPPDLKKEREIAQMVAGLDLNDDSTLHRNTSMTNGHGRSSMNNRGEAASVFGKVRR